jgi:hypothetical protein
VPFSAMPTSWCITTFLPGRAGIIGPTALVKDRTRHSKRNAQALRARMALTPWCMYMFTSGGEPSLGFYSWATCFLQRGHVVFDCLGSSCCSIVGSPPGVNPSFASVAAPILHPLAVTPSFVSFAALLVSNPYYPLSFECDLIMPFDCRFTSGGEPCDMLPLRNPLCGIHNILTSFAIFFFRFSRRQ